jgi:DNA-binding PadR family transcriptional regulator
MYLADTYSSMAVSRTRFAVLGALTLGPRSGYGLRQLIDGSLGNFWRESYGQLYPVLRALVAEGLAENAVAGEEGGQGERAQYRITPPGRAELQRWLDEPAAEEVPRVEVLLKLFFAADLPPERRAAHVRRHVGRCRALHEARLARYAAIEARLAEQHAEHPGRPYWLATVRYGQHASRAALAWCDETLAALGGASADDPPLEEDPT